MSLQQKVINSMMWSSIGQFTSIGLAFISNLVLARLLTPDDFGCIGMLSIFLAISAAFINGGFGMALVQKKYASMLDFTTIFYWNLFVSIVFVVVLYFAAPYIASFYGIPLLTDLLRVLSLDLIIVALSIVPTNQLKKDLMFKQLATRTIVSTTIATTVTIYLAYHGWGVWSIVVNQLLKSTITLIMIWSMTTWKPTLDFSFAALKEMFGFGSMMLLSGLINTIYVNLNGLLIGKFFSASQLGYYAQARKLEEVPSFSLSAVINEVSFSAFSTLQEQKDRLLQGLRKNVNAVAFFCFPLFFLMILVAPTLIPLLFGDKWEPSVMLFRILCLGSMLFTLNNIHESAIKALGKGKIYFTVFTFNKLLGLAMVLLGVKFGINGMLWGLVIAIYIGFAINMIVNKKLLSYTWKMQLIDLLPYYTLSIISLVTSYFVTALLQINSIVEMFINLICFATIYVIIAYVFKLSGLHTYLNVIKTKLKK